MKTWFITGGSRGFGRQWTDGGPRGRNMIETARAEYDRRLEMWESWRRVSEAAHGTPNTVGGHSRGGTDPRQTAAPTRRR